MSGGRLEGEQRAAPGLQEEEAAAASPTSRWQCVADGDLEEPVYQTEHMSYFGGGFMPKIREIYCEK